MVRTKITLMQPQFRLPDSFVKKEINCNIQINKNGNKKWSLEILKLKLLYKAKKIEQKGRNASMSSDHVWSHRNNCNQSVKKWTVLFCIVCGLVFCWILFELQRMINFKCLFVGQNELVWRLFLFIAFKKRVYRSSRNVWAQSLSKASLNSTNKNH